MAKFIVSVSYQATVILNGTLIVDADSKEEAEEAAQDAFEEGDIEMEIGSELSADEVKYTTEEVQ